MMLKFLMCAASIFQNLLYRPIPTGSCREGETAPFAVKCLSLLAGMANIRSQEDSDIPRDEKENCHPLPCAPGRRIFRTCAATDVSRRYLWCRKNAPTDVGGYTLLANRARYELSELGDKGSIRPSPWRGTSDAERKLNGVRHLFFHLSRHDAEVATLDIEGGADDQKVALTCGHAKRKFLPVSVRGLTLPSHLPRSVDVSEVLRFERVTKVYQHRQI